MLSAFLSQPPSTPDLKMPLPEMEGVVGTNRKTWDYFLEEAQKGSTWQTIELLPKIS